METLAERRVAQVMGCAAKTCSLIHSLLILQSLNPEFKPRNRTFARRPMLKGLSLLEQI